jgi:hypothetical protein
LNPLGCPIRTSLVGHRGKKKKKKKKKNEKPDGKLNFVDDPPDADDAGRDPDAGRTRGVPALTSRIAERVCTVV